MPRPSFDSRLSRRDWLTLSAAGVVSVPLSGWLGTLAAHAANDPQRKRSCILLWMNGGPSQMDTFDLKPGTKNGGPFSEIQTSAPGLRISEHLPNLAKYGHRMAVVRSMSTKEAEHGRATFVMRTGYNPIGPIQYPGIGSLLSKELGSMDSPLPNCVAIAPSRSINPAAYGPGFLGPLYAPLNVGDNIQLGQQAQPGAQPADVDYGKLLRVQDVDTPEDVDPAHAAARLDLLQDVEDDFVRRHPGVAPQSHQTAYNRAVKLMRTTAAKAFNLDEEPSTVRDAYGRSLFGQGCLLARRLVERGVPFVEVSLGGDNGLVWDTHVQNFDTVRTVSRILDPAWATLMSDLEVRGLLDSTLIVWMGEFGRTPAINPNQGRDHWATSWSTVLAGGGIKGGQAVGKTSEDGMEVADRPVSVADFMATTCSALGIDPLKTNLSNVDRPIPIADRGAVPIQEVLA
ncbi:MAG TPA: DUF1501 domain-containing protein [Gemmataceae bacterium]|nr:DUF1501 domain-containing protein [Gemmataceae bacterium]